MSDREVFPPDWSKARIADEKITGYLLNLEHKEGRSKAVLFLRIGFRRDAWQQLRDALLRHHVGVSKRAAGTNNFGVKYAVEAQLEGPGGSALVQSVWIVHFGEDIPRLLTAYPLSD